MLPEGWRKETFSDGVNLISGQHVEAQLVNSQGQGVPYLTGPADFPNGEIITTRYTQSGNAFCEKDDILITVKGSGTGKVIRSDGYYAISRQLMAVRAKKYDPNFTYFSLCHNIIRYQDAAAGLIPGIGRNDILSTPILLPPLPEQKKIAAILSTWDRAIEGTEKLLANSQQQKKALMQQLLTGKKRLPGFTGEWENVLLKNIALIKKGQALSSKDLMYGDYPVIAGGKTSPYTHKHFTHENVITVSASGAYAGYVSFHSYKIWASDCSVITSRSGNNISFIYFWLSYLQNKIFSLQSGGAQPHIYPRDLELLHIHCPPLPEQKAIAAVLTTADEEIAAIESDFSRLRQEKKALMQQLLTGKRRVKVD